MKAAKLDKSGALERFAPFAKVLGAHLSHSTCSVLHKKAWSQRTPAIGHSLLIARAVHELFGGKLYTGHFNSVSAGLTQVPHYWNYVPVVIDKVGDLLGIRGQKIVGDKKVTYGPFEIDLARPLLHSDVQIVPAMPLAEIALEEAIQSERRRDCTFDNRYNRYFSRVRLALG